MPGEESKCCCDPLPVEPGCWTRYVTSCECEGDPFLEEIRYVLCDEAADCIIFRDASTDLTRETSLCFRRTATELTELTNAQRDLVRNPLDCYEECELCCDDELVPPRCNFTGCSSCVCCVETTFLVTMTDVTYCGFNPTGGNHFGPVTGIVSVTVGGVDPCRGESEIPCSMVQYNALCVDNTFDCECQNYEINGQPVTGVFLSCEFDFSPPSQEGSGTGACCFPGSVCLDSLSKAACEALGGIYMGDGGDCTDPDVCNFSTPRYIITIAITGEPAAACQTAGIQFVQDLSDADQEALCPTGTYFPITPGTTGTITVA